MIRMRVLFTVKNLEHGRRGISSEIVAHFIDFIQQDERITRTSLLQSSDKQPSYLWERYKAFFPTAEAKLRAMKPEEFAQIQQAIIAQMLQAPQTLGAEASQLSKDFDRGNMRFDSRDKIVAQIKLLTPQKLADFFHQNSLPMHTLSPYCLVGSPTRQNARQYLQVWKYRRIVVFRRNMSRMGAHGEMPVSVHHLPQ